VRPSPLTPDDPPDRRTEIGARVADRLAEALIQGPRAAVQAARDFSDEEIRLGLEFLATVLDIAASSTRAITTVLVERGEHHAGWN
jgi:hypothetical protein